MNVIYAVVLFAAFFYTGWWVQDIKAFRVLRQFMPPDENFAIRRHMSQRKMNAIKVVLEKTGRAFVRCEECENWFFRRTNCMRCQGKGYREIAASNIQVGHVPSWKGFKAEMDFQRFSGLIKKKHIYNLPIQE